MWWPGPDPVELADGSLVLCATAPRAGVVVVRAIGEIDLLTAPAWRRMLSAAVFIAASPAPPGSGVPAEAAPVAAGRCTPRLVCDLTAVTFFGVSGLNVLVGLVVLAAEHGVELSVVTDDRGLVGRLLRVSGLDRRVAVRKRLEDAVASSLSAGGPRDRRARARCRRTPAVGGDPGVRALGDLAQVAAGVTDGRLEALLRASLTRHATTSAGQDGRSPDPATAVLTACAHLAAGGREET